MRVRRRSREGMRMSMVSLGMIKGREWNWC